MDNTHSLSPAVQHALDSQHQAYNRIPSTFSGILFRNISGQTAERDIHSRANGLTCCNAPLHSLRMYVTAHSRRDDLHGPSCHGISPRSTGTRLLALGGQDSTDKHIPLSCDIPRTTFLAQHQHHTNAKVIRHGQLAVLHRSSCA